MTNPGNSVRVLHVAEALTGGVATYLNEIAQAQSEYFGAENVAFAVPKSQANQLTNAKANRRFLLPGWGRSPINLMKMYLALRDAIRNWRPDLVHLHSTFAGALVRSHFLLGGDRPAVVYCAHGWAFLRETSPLNRLACVGLERLLATRTDRIVSISQTEHNAALVSGLPRDKLCRIDNGISKNSRRGTGSPKHRFDGGNLNLLFVGRHDRQKGIDVLLRFMKGLRGHPVHLHVVGAPVLTQRQHVDDGQENVTFHSWTAHEEIDLFIAEADVVVVPSRWEGFGLVALEAMRAAKPVLASNRGALPEIVGDFISGRIFPLEDEAMFRQIVLNTTTEQWSRFGRQGQQRFLEHYTADRMNQEITSLYESTLAPISKRMVFENAPE